MQPINSFEHAIRTDNLSRHYGSGKKIVNVLNSITMTVPRGKIYGLLGASGSGKTTLLKCITGQLHVHGGSLEVLGKPPLTKGHPVPGPAIGYMPQEIALYAEFTVTETFSFFGKLHKMTKTELNERQHHLLELLELSGFEQRLIRQLSGGQQRRMSLAIALLHKGSLVILDEPTVGVDAMLRAKLWHYFLDLVKNEGVTLLITTHYIEEARQADIVALMRDGRLLAEDSPDALMSKYNKSTLEDVFLELCRRNPTQEEDVTSAPRAIAISKNDNDERTPLLASSITTAATTTTTSTTAGPRRSFWPEFYLPVWQTVFALFWKNLTRIRRHYGFLIFMFFLPALQVSIFCLAIGRTPQGLNVAVVNNDLGSDIDPLLCQYNGTFTPNASIPQFLSSVFLSNLPSKTITQIQSSTLQEAEQKVKDGSAWAVFELDECFSIDILLRYTDANGLINGNATVAGMIVNGSRINLYQDNSNQQISLTIQQVAFQAFENTMQIALPGYGKSGELASSPVVQMKPIFGQENPTFTNFIAPNILGFIIFALSIGLTALSLVIEQKEGMVSRIYAAGTHPIEIILAQLCSQTVILLVQITFMLIFALAVFKIPLAGNLFFPILFMLFMGLLGMTYGMFISTTVSAEVEAIQVALGTFFPVLLLSGVFWPVEGIPVPLLYLSKALPTTWGADAMRSVLIRGWSLEEDQVWQGFLMILAWELVFLTASVFRIRRTQP